MDKNEMLYNLYDENCPSRHVLEIISNKWTILIIDLIALKTYRFGDLRREIGGISQKVLTENLRELERNGFVHRIEYDEKPLKVEYSLTDLGLNLREIYAQITLWSGKNIAAILDSQKLFDER